MKKLLTTTALVAMTSTAVLATDRIEDLHFTADPNPIIVAPGTTAHLSDDKTTFVSHGAVTGYRTISKDDGRGFNQGTQVETTSSVLGTAGTPTITDGLLCLVQR